MKIHGWGRYPIIEANILTPQSQSECAHLIKDGGSLIARGLGRSYGDSAISSSVIESSHLNHYTEFDDVNGVITCEAGVLLREILQLAVHRGWFLGVTPGSSFVTVGGAIASDVHGKNHHINGTFSEYVESFELMLGTGEIVIVSRTNLPDLFRATCGGMGLTGVILAATIKLKPIKSNSIIQTTIKTKCLEEVCDQFENNLSSTYSVAWIDCLANGKQLGRSLLMLGEHAQEGALEIVNSKVINLPFMMPKELLNNYSIKAFNSLYYHKVRSDKKISTISLQSYFYPLDSIGNWNRLYGKAGFVQYQFALPKAAGVNGLRKILNTIANSQEGSFLAVLKTFGESNQNYLSFPIEGYTLALDFKVSEKTIQLIKKLDLMVADLGGRLYLTKDALMSEKMFKTTYPNWQEFEKVRAKYGAIGKFSSNQSKRLGLQ